MKTFNSFFSLFTFVILCFANISLQAQIQAMPGSHLTSNQFTSAQIVGYGGNAVAIYNKPNGFTNVQLASYSVNSSGEIQQLDTEDFGDCGSQRLVMLDGKRVIVAMRNKNQNHEVRVYDLDNAGKISKKDWWASTGGGAVNPLSQNVERLTSSSFVSVVVDGGTFRILSFTVNSSGNITFKDDDTHNIAGNAVYIKRMSSSRVIVGIKNTNNVMKLICYDINASTGVLSKKGEVQISNVRQATMSAFGGRQDSSL